MGTDGPPTVRRPSRACKVGASPTPAGEIRDTGSGPVERALEVLAHECNAALIAAVSPTGRWHSHPVQGAH